MDKRKFNKPTYKKPFLYLSEDSKDFVNKVLEDFNLTFEEIKNTRKRPIIQIKQVLFWFLKNKFKEGLSSIARHFNLTHATIIHANKQAQFIIDNNRDIYYYIYEKMVNVYRKDNVHSACLDIMFELNFRRNENIHRSTIK